MSRMDLPRTASRVSCAAVCLGLTYFGFEYESLWDFFGAVVAFLGVLE